LDFTRKLATRAPWLSGGDIAELRRHQINDESILEAVMVTGLTSLFCTLSAGLGPFCDFELKAIPPVGKMPPAAVGAYVGGTGGPYVLTVERSPESFPPFAFFLNRFGFIPNVFRAQTLRPDVIEAEAAAGPRSSATRRFPLAVAEGVHSPG
jgi:hypothetical protein